MERLADTSERTGGVWLRVSPPHYPRSRPVDTISLPKMGVETMNDGKKAQAKTWLQKFDANKGVIGVIGLVVLAVVCLQPDDKPQPTPAAEAAPDPERTEAYRTYVQFVVSRNMVLDQAPAAFGATEAQIIDAIIGCMRNNNMQSEQAQPATLDCRRVDVDVAAFGPRRPRPEEAASSS
jgi:hypothetical protein